jgi:hypothetical protein
MRPAGTRHQAALVGSLPEIMARLPKPDELRSVTIGGRDEAGAAGLIAQLIAVTTALRDRNGDKAPEDLAMTCQAVRAGTDSIQRGPHHSAEFSSPTGVGGEVPRRKIMKEHVAMPSRSGLG